MNKKRFALAMTVVMCLAMMAGCSSGGSTSISEAQESSESSAASIADVSESVSEVSEGSEANSSTPVISSGDVPIVYFTSDISPEGLMAVYEALGRTPTGNVGVKISTGEPPNSNYLRTELIGEFVQSVNGTFIECNTAYAGSRSATAMHYQVAEDHGYTAVANVVIMDEDGSMSLPILNGTHLAENLVGAHFDEYDFHIVLSHFKGHGMAGFGGALKNMSIGYASADGKNNIHSAGDSAAGWTREQDDFLESMAEAAKSIVDAAGEENFLYINVLNRLSVSCDCDGNPDEPDMHDIGIIASLDPVAVDRAGLDLVFAAPDGASLTERVNSRNGAHTVDHAAALGLGSLEYELVSID